MIGSDKERKERLKLLVIVICLGGILSLVWSNDIAPNSGWSHAVLRVFVAIAGMFLSGAYAFASVTEHRFAQRARETLSTSIFILIVGGIAAISVGNGSAAFLMLILTGFSLNWWGTARE